MCKKVAKACGFLAKLRHCAHIDTLISVYYALIYSYLRYGIISWGNASQTTLLQPLNSLANRAVRIMTYAPFGNIDVDSIYKYLNSPKLSQTISLEVGKFIYKKQNRLLPDEDIASHFELRNSNAAHQYNLRNRKVHLPTISLNSGRGEKSIQFRGSKLWNEIPDEIRCSESFNVFKKYLKEFLIEDLPDESDDIYFYY